MPARRSPNGWSGLALPAGSVAQIDDQIAHRLIAIGRVLLERLLDCKTQRDRELRAERLGRSIDDRLQHLEVRRTREGPPAREQLVEHHAEREHVTARVEPLAPSLLR